ncbi:hypothetical protein H072_9118 [Dactylellina haptotyla CBS 200.50]|uniref:Uncharacterized protein n=1 Tax=Dactylellina haptotyla (strain CBS 200.50) TaxID=1284197 RepID=S8A3A8_DACHA|nr:hypothetical protein H072_9118 [Dactylellina haptotyla CBS 200.50]
MNKKDQKPLEGALVWNRPDTPATLAFALYGQPDCKAITSRRNPRRPDAIMVLDMTKLRGVHRIGVRSLGLDFQLKSWQGIRVQDELLPEFEGYEGLLYKIPADKLPGLIVYWDDKNRRRMKRAGVKWVNGTPYQGLEDPSLINQYLKEVMERELHLDVDSDNPASKDRMRAINAAVGIEGTQLANPPIEDEEESDEFILPVADSYIVGGEITNTPSELELEAGIEDRVIENQKMDVMQTEKEDENVEPISDISQDNGGPTRVQRVITSDGGPRIVMDDGTVVGFTNGRAHIVDEALPENTEEVEDSSAALPQIPDTLKLGLDIGLDRTNPMDVSSWPLNVEAIKQRFERAENKQMFMLMMTASVIYGLRTMAYAESLMREYENSAIAPEETEILPEALQTENSATAPLESLRDFDPRVMEKLDENTRYLRTNGELPGDVVSIGNEGALESIISQLDGTPSMLESVRDVEQTEPMASLETVNKKFHSMAEITALELPENMVVPSNNIMSYPEFRSLMQNYLRSDSDSSERVGIADSASFTGRL